MFICSMSLCGAEAVSDTATVCDITRFPSRPILLNLAHSCEKEPMPAYRSLLRNSVARLLKHPSKMQSTFGIPARIDWGLLLGRFPSAAKKWYSLFGPWGTPMPRNRRRHKRSIVPWKKQSSKHSQRLVD